MSTSGTGAVTVEQVIETENRWFRKTHDAEFAPPSGTGDACAGGGNDGPLDAARNASPNLSKPSGLGTERSVTDDGVRFALCLSGGGIRSATFSLGVLQALAEKGLLGRFHYLSSVSGGGYIASWLSSWVMRIGLTNTVDALAKSAREQPAPVRRLRAFANYLSPVWGLSGDFFALAAIFIRNLAVHWCVVLPLFAAALLLPRLNLSLLGTVWSTPHPAAFALAVGVLSLVWTIAYFAADLPGDPDSKKRVPKTWLGKFLNSPLLAPKSTKVNPKNRFAVACFLPLLVAAVALSFGLRWWGYPPLSIERSMLFVAGLHFLGAVLGVIWRRHRGLEPRPRKKIGITALLDLVYIGASGAIGGLFFYGVGWVSERWSTTEGLQLLTVFCVPALLVAFWAGVTAYAATASRITTEEDREWWARSAGWWLGAGVAWLLASGLVIYLPRWVLETWLLQTEPGPPAAGLIATVIGALTGAAGYWSKNGATVAAKAKTVLQAVRMRALDAAALLSILTLVIAMSYSISCTLRTRDDKLSREVTRRQNDTVAMRTYVDDKERFDAAVKQDRKMALEQTPLAARSVASYETVLEATEPVPILKLLGALVAFGCLVSWLIGINAFSLHSMYGNRLARAYLGASNSLRRPHPFTGFDPLDNPRLANLIYRKDPDLQTDVLRDERKLFHVINIALNLVQVSSNRLDWQQRKAASFTMTPLHCGSAGIGYAPTRAYGGDQEGMSLGRAMAISGAAASPNMGYHSSKLVSFVMTLFNVRLGWWMPNPAEHFRKIWSKREPTIGLEALYAEAIAGATDERRFVYLSDGGHFENLGIYEMVRRRCRVIVAVDATSDPNYVNEDLQAAIQKIRVDFGVSIAFDEPLVSADTSREADRCVSIGSINYPAAGYGSEMGTLIYIKPALPKNLPLDVKRYAESHTKAGSAFPHQATSDQFFDEAQFESYRMLGYEIVRRDFPRDGSWPTSVQYRASGPRAGDVSSVNDQASKMEGNDGKQV